MNLQQETKTETIKSERKKSMKSRKGLTVNLRIVRHQESNKTMLPLPHRQAVQYQVFNKCPASHQAKKELQASYTLGEANNTPALRRAAALSENL